MGPEDEWQSIVSRARGDEAAWRPALAWAAGAIGAGLIQASVAVAAREDAGVAQLSAAGTAMAAGTWLYLQGVKRILTPSQQTWTKAGLAAGSYVSAIVGVGLATVPVGPVRMAGIGLDVLASQGFHTALTDAFICSEQVDGRHESLRDHGSPALKSSTAAICTLAVVALAGSAIVISNVAHLGAAEAAGAALFCHALIGSSVSAILGLRAWQRHQEALSPRRGWQSA